MSSIFISYRRGDSSGHAGRLFAHLIQHFRKERVFMDVAGIEPGIDFVEAIEKALSSCSAFLVVIGKDWLDSKDKKGSRRLEDLNDFVRLEIQTALERNIRVIPVLIEGAVMPAAGNLPDVLAALVRRQPIEISDNRWDYDSGRLIEALDKVIGKPPDAGHQIKYNDANPASTEIPQTDLYDIGPGQWQIDMKVFGLHSLTMFVDLAPAGQFTGQQRSIGISTSFSGMWSFDENRTLRLLPTSFLAKLSYQSFHIQIMRQEGDLIYGKDNLMRQFILRRTRGGP